MTWNRCSLVTRQMIPLTSINHEVLDSNPPRLRTAVEPMGKAIYFHRSVPRCALKNIDYLITHTYEAVFILFLFEFIWFCIHQKYNNWTKDNINVLNI